MKQKSLLDYICKKREEYTCEFCNVSFKTKKGLLIHRTKKHEIYSDEDIQVKDIDDNHIQINIKIRKALYNDLMMRVKRAKTDLANYLLEAFAFGDFLFDENVKAYISQRSYQSLREGIKNEVGEIKKPAYIQ